MATSSPSGRARLAVLCAALAAAPGAAEMIPGRNVNMVSGRDWPRGDPFLQRQNEGSLAVSTRNWLHLLGAGNDYRTVDLAAALTGGRVVGDAWHGIFRSTDGGNTWRSTLLPGYPQDTSPEGLASPLKGYDAGADPLVRAGANGLFFHSGIVFDRDPHGKGALFVARFIDLNNKENREPVRYLDTSVIDTGSAGQFVDKPWMFVDIPRAGAANCSIQVPPQAGTLTQSLAAAAPVTQSFPAGNVYVSYTIFLGNKNTTRTKMMFARSRDCGGTWTRIKVSEGFPLNQGSSIAVDDVTGAVYLAWRQFKTDHVRNAILIAKSIDGGATFTKASQVTELTPFQQGTTPVSARINSFPTLIAHGGRVYLAYSEKGPGPGGDARTLIMSSSDGLIWTPPMVAVPDPERGHHFFPALAVVNGRLVLTYYALREDNTFGVLTPAGGGQYTESRVLAGDLAPPDPQPAKVFTDFLMEVPPAGYGFGPLKRRHTVDVWIADADPGPAPVFHAVRASQYVFGSRPTSSTIEQLQFNPPLLKMFQLGTVPFFSDYIDVGVRPFRPTATGWVHDDGASNRAAHIVWTDNRDVRPPADGDWTHYTPVSSAAVGGTSKFDPSQPVPACVVGQTGMRNQNLYTVRVTQGLYVGSPGNAKPLGAIQRAFVVFAQNTRAVATSYRFSIAGQPPGGQASFLQTGMLTTLDVLVPARSTASRSVFVTSSNPHASVTVDVTEIAGPGGAPVPGGQTGELVFNADPTTPDISNPDISNPDISNPDISNAEVHNPDISNPDISNPDISNPDISNPDISNPDISNYEVANPDISNPDISNPDISNPDISNPDISNPDISNPDISNGAISDTNWTATNDGNTASSYTVNLLADGDPPPGFKLQLVVYRTYTTPVAKDCELKVQTHNVVIANVPDPSFATLADFSDPDTLNPAAVTLDLAPGETARITLRVVDPNRFDAVTWSPVEHVVPVVVAHAANTGETQPPFTLARPILLFATPPTNTETGQVIVPAVQVKALDGNGDPLSGVSVTVALGSNPGGGTLSGTTTRVTDALGIATFTGLAIDRAGKGYTLAASAPGLLPATSAPFDVDATISFERFPDGTPACASCALTNQFASRGVVFSFFSDFTPATEAGLFDSAAYDPPGGPTNHSVTAAILPPPGGGFSSGTVVMEYAGLPTTVVFRLRGNDSIPVYPVAAFGPGLTPIPAAQITRSNVSTYTSPGGFLFRQETVTITDPGGVERVELGMNGFIVLVDNLRLQ